MINSFNISGEIVEIKEDRTILVNHKKTVITIKSDNKLKLEKYCVGEKVEVSGYISTYKPLYIIQLIATKIKKETEKI